MIEFSSHIEVAVGDTAKDTQYFLFEGLSVVHFKKSRIAWVCLTESMPDTCLLYTSDAADE